MTDERPDQSPITSPRSERVRRIAALAGRSARRKQGRFRVEGPQAVRSLLAEQPQLAADLYLTPDADAAHPELTRLAGEARVPVHRVDPPVLGAMVREGDGALVTPQGAIAVGHLPSEGEDSAADAICSLPGDGPVTVTALHEVRDPGNVGTLIRTADAAGADLVILTRTCADPYAPKAVRASVGSLFHLPVVAGAAIEDVLQALDAHGITAAATSGHAELDLFTADLPARIAWLMGNEAHGLDAATLQAAPLAVRIPLAGRAESLNVHTAATVCLFESLRRRSRT